ncbi:MAG: hypothetical protein JW928_04915 [Candidatus Aureabacteria bacterium]|nr:hypothetical protein [Candidatus Auribacterota bacterium]
MKKISIFMLVIIFVLICGCETTTKRVRTPARVSSEASMSIEEMERSIIGTWNVIQTSTTDETLENEMKYTFMSEGNRCRKKNLFHGYFEELTGIYTMRKRGQTNYLTIRFDNGYEEKFTFFFQNQNRLSMTYLTGQYKYEYVLERVEDDIFDIM